MNNNKTPLKKQPWQPILSDLITDPAELIDALALETHLLPAAQASATQFPLRMPRAWLKAIEKGNVHDPLLRQVLPLWDEQRESASYVEDPLQEQNANPIPGLLHKYHGRVLVTLTSACAIHCRYCFRRHFPYADNQPGRAGWSQLIDYIKQDTTITEVILSGGDPLTVGDTLLQHFTDLLAQIAHINTLRIHTRVPVVLPERITPTLLHWLRDIRFKKVIVIHANHANEINDDVMFALNKFKLANAMLLNQSVLLKGVNDDVETLANLSERLFACDVLPYYLHILDKVKGAAHFDLPLAEAKAIHAALTQRLPGYLVPKLVCEVAGEGSKRMIEGSFESTDLSTDKK